MLKKSKNIKCLQLEFNFGMILNLGHFSINVNVVYTPNTRTKLVFTEQMLYTEIFNRNFLWNYFVPGKSFDWKMITGELLIRVNIPIPC